VASFLIWAEADFVVFCCRILCLWRFTWVATGSAASPSIFHCHIFVGVTWLHLPLVTEAPSIARSHGFHKMPWLHHPLTPTAPSILHHHGLQKCHGPIIKLRLRLLPPSSIAIAAPSVAHSHGFHKMPWLHHPLTPTAPSNLHRHGLQKFHGSIIKLKLWLLPSSSMSTAAPSIAHSHGFQKVPWLHHPLTLTAPSILHLRGLHKYHGSIIKLRLRLLPSSSITMALSKCYGAII